MSLVQPDANADGRHSHIRSAALITITIISIIMIVLVMIVVVVTTIIIMIIFTVISIRWVNRWEASEVRMSEQGPCLLFPRMPSVQGTPRF